MSIVDEYQKIYISMLALFTVFVLVIPKYLLREAFGTSGIYDSSTHLASARRELY